MRILILGLGNSGKSTFARDLGRVLPIPVYHLDRLLWRSHWDKCSRRDFERLQDDVLHRPDWIYEGFNRKSVDYQIQFADIVVYIHASRITLTINWIDRLQRYRNQARPDMTEGNIEKFNLSYLHWLWK